MILPGCNNQVLTRAQLYQYAHNAGFSGTPADIIVAIAFAESGANTCSYNPTDPFGGSFGVLQINGAHFGANGMTKTCALDPACAFNFAHGLWAAQGFQPWGTYTNGSYKSFINTAGTSGTQAAQPAPTGSGNPLQDIANAVAWLNDPVRIIKIVAGIILIGGAIFLLVAPDATKAAVQVAKVAA